MRSVFDIRHPYFRPLWVRLPITAIVLGWALVEALSGNLVWALVFAAGGGWLVYGWFVIFDPADYEKQDDDTPG
ncbi:hypothetical protein HKCCE3408_19210 [Rhodobacterales bacterium HKCCE3408]|nr:hypothetical protein [Rhodobacterales bacterium HKCCE3408]